MARRFLHTKFSKTAHGEAVEYYLKQLTGIDDGELMFKDDFGFQTTEFTSQKVVRKVQRMDFDPAERVHLYNSCCKSIPGCRFELPYKRNDVERSIQQLKEHLDDYDLHDPFKIIFPVDVANKVELFEEKFESEYYDEYYDEIVVRDLFVMNYVNQRESVKIKDFARSNEFFHSWTADYQYGLHTDLHW
mmetsp:Transcript_53583/g.130495  ORF Transcript_53583/g.130495 Transcript_53583/m.130495 type:complete len:189 (+) Transcript_53583:739-1305(+)